MKAGARKHSSLAGGEVVHVVRSSALARLWAGSFSLPAPSWPRKQEKAALCGMVMDG